MAVTDYIAIRGFSASGTEVFQGIGAGAPSETTATPNRDPGVPDVYEPPITATPLAEDTELADLIWQGQNEKLDHENEYCSQLQTNFEKKRTQLSTVKDKIIEYAKQIVEEFVGWLAAAFVFWTTENVALAFYAKFAGEAVAEWGFEHLLLLLERGNALLTGIQDENKKLLQLEKSRENYEYRELVLARHREDIKIILEQIRLAEKQVEVTQYMEMKALLERLTDLALREDTVEIGNTKFHTHGKVLNYK